MKVVINTCFGGFGLSRKAVDLYCKKKGINPGKWDSQFKFYHDFQDWNISRDDPILIEVIEQLGSDANGFCAQLSIVNIPDDVSWYIDEYDGLEHVAETHRTWR